MSLRTTQQIDKLIVGQIFPRDCNNNYIPTGQILLTDATGRANWTTLSSVTGTYTQFTSLSTQKGTILATALDTAIHIEEGGKIRCVVPDRSVNDLIKQKFEVLEVLEVLEEIVVTTEETPPVEIPKKFPKPSTCIKTNLDQLKLP